MQRLDAHLVKAQEILIALGASGANAREIAKLRHLVDSMYEVSIRWADILKSEKK